VTIIVYERVTMLDNRVCKYTVIFNVKCVTVLIFQYQTIFRNPKEVKPYDVPFPERCNLPAAAIHASSDTVVVVDMDAPAAHVVQHKWQPNTPDGQGTPFLFQHRKATLASAGGTIMRMFKAPPTSSVEWQFPQAVAFAVSGIRSQAIVSITCNKEVITGKSRNA